MRRHIDQTLMKKMLAGYRVSLGRDLTKEEGKARKKKNRAQKAARRKNRKK